MLRGEVAALTAAFLWALSTVIFGQLGKSISPLVLNLAKGAIAIALIILTLVIQQNLQPQLPPAAIFWLMLSGVVGIGLGDTAYFKSINHFGARRALLMETLAPPLTALMALFFCKKG
jgi:drug/metabolite transporter (DMT)-like permease